jgi:DNA primase
VAGRILKDDIEALRQQADIVAVAGDHTTLKRAGRSYKGLCPFHTERTPSFTVTAEGNFYHCFGCGASGDIYDFLMRVEGMQFPEAVEALARRTGVTLRYEQLSAREQRAIGERSRLVAVTTAAASFFHAQLYGDAGQVARDYLKERGFGRPQAEAFTLGFAPMGWETLSRALSADGHDPRDLVTVGVSVRTDRGGLRDRFRGRLMFPIQDPGGDVIGFGGRVLDALDHGRFTPPKYLNTNETPLYKKSRVLYGLPQARAEIVRAEQVLVCEGYTDVMALHQAGMGNALATCGTAVGVEHLRMIARHAQRVVLAFDGDAAGIQAAERAWAAARELSTGAGDDGPVLDLRVLELPPGRDPADIVRDDGVEAIVAAVAEAIPVIAFVIRHRLEDADLDSEAGRIAALREALRLAGREPDPDLRREWVRSEVAPRVGVSYGFAASTAARLGIELDVHEGIAVSVGPVGSDDWGGGRVPAGPRSGARRGHQQRGDARRAAGESKGPRGGGTGGGAGGGGARPGGGTRGGAGGGAGRGGVGGGAGDQAARERGDASETASARLDRRRVRLEREVLRAALQRPDLLPEEWYELTDQDFTHATARQVFETLVAAGGAGVDPDAVVAGAPDDATRGVVRALLLEDDPALGQEDIAGVVAGDRVRQLYAERLRAEEDLLRERLARLHHEVDRAELLATQRRLATLEARRRALRSVGP